MTREAEALRVAQQFPTVSAMARAFRDAFGQGVKLRYGREPDGREIGSREYRDEVQRELDLGRSQ